MKLRNKILTVSTVVASALAFSAPAQAVDVDYFGWSLLGVVFFLSLTTIGGSLPPLEVFSTSVSKSS